jgi:hypothetical protein
MKALVLLTAGMMALTCWTAQGGVIEGAEIQAGVDIFHYHYREPDFMRLSGPQVGLYGSFTYLALHPWRLELQAAVAGGDISYDGAYSDGTPLKGDVGNAIFQLRPLVGYTIEDIALGNLASIKLIPYSGIAYRYLFNNLEDLGRGGYTREQGYYYLPLGLEGWVSWPGDELLTLGARIELDILIIGKHTTGPIRGWPWPGNTERNFTQNSGWGLQFAPQARYEVADQVSLKVELYYRYWNIPDSTVDRDSYEPANTTSEYGLRMGVAF